MLRPNSVPNLDQMNLQMQCFRYQNKRSECIKAENFFKFSFCIFFFVKLNCTYDEIGSSNVIQIYGTSCFYYGSKGQCFKLESKMFKNFNNLKDFRQS